MARTRIVIRSSVFFFNDTATTEIYTLSLHDALPIFKRAQERGLLSIAVHNIRDATTDKHHVVADYPYGGGAGMVMKPEPIFRSEQHTSELQSQSNLVCRLLLEKKSARRLAISVLTPS